MKHRLLRKCIIVCGLVGGMVMAGNAAAYTESTSCSAYSTISGDPSAVILNTVSTCDDCTELVSLPFLFQWWGDTPTTAVRVSSNGQINIDSTNTSSNCCSADPVEVGGYTDPRIALAQEDLNPGASGTIYALDTGTSLIIEYNTVFYSNSGSVNAQVEMFPDGNVELRWGRGDNAGNSIAAGVEDDTRESADEDAKFIMWCYDNSDFIEQVAQLKEALVRLVRPSVEGAVMNALSELVTAATSNKEKST